MADVTLNTRFRALEACLQRAARAPGLRSDPGLAVLLQDGERHLSELRAEVGRLAQVRDAFAGVRAQVGEKAPVERLQPALLEAYQRALPLLGEASPRG